MFFKSRLTSETNCSVKLWRKRGNIDNKFSNVILDLSAYR